MFHRRTERAKALVHAVPDPAQFSVMATARLTMSGFGAVRALRRAADCAWVVDGNDEDIAIVQSIVHLMLVINPCADAARAELRADAPAEGEMQPLERAVRVLLSDTCEVLSENLISAEVLDPEDEYSLSNRIVESEAVAQDSVDSLLDDAVVADESAGSSLAQTIFSARRALNILGAIFLVMLYLFACTSIAAVISFALLLILALLTCSLPGPQCLLIPMFGGTVGAGFGFGRCGYELIAGNTSSAGF